MSRSVIFFIFWIFQACGLTRPPGLIVNGLGPGYQKMTPDLNSIQQNFVNTKCLSCHSNPTSLNRNVSLTDIFQLIEGKGSGIPGARKDLIKPGCPDQSFFLSILKEGKMPPRPDYAIGSEDLKIIEEWILSLKSDQVISCSDEPGD